METNAGYVILKSERYEHSNDFSVEKSIVLGYKSGKGEWVTWEKRGDGAAASYYWGHYFADERAAEADYHRRLAEKYEDKMIRKRG